MTAAQTIGRVLGSAAALIALTACASHGSIPELGPIASDAVRAGRTATTLYVLNGGNDTVTIYKAPFTSKSAPIQTVKLGTPSGEIVTTITVSNSGTLFVANGYYDYSPHRSVDMYEPPYKRKHAVAKSVWPSALTVGAQNSLIVADANGIEIFSYPYTHAPFSAFAGFNPQVDAHQRLFVQEQRSVDEFEGPYYSSPVWIIQTPFRRDYSLLAMTVSPSGDLFLTSEDFKQPIVLFKPPYKNVTAKIPKHAKGFASELSALSSGNVFAALTLSGSYFAVDEYVAPYQAPPKKISFQNAPGLILARDGWLFMSNEIGGVAAYAAPFDGAPAEITSGIDDPRAIAVLP